MNYQSLTVAAYKSFIKTTTAILFIFVLFAGAFAQYKGAPVKRDRLIKALKSRQLQTEDIVAVIKTNGVDFPLTAEIKQTLIAAGARPEVIRAVETNQRGANSYAKSNRRNKVSDYEDLLEQAMYSFKEQKNPQTAMRYLQTALKMRPNDPKAYQMLGFINLYGANNLAEAQKYMRQAILKGGSAVFRVFHDDQGSFTGRCSGSLYISPERIRFESDNNVHTFETSTVNIDKVKLDRESSRVWKNYPIFKLLFKLGKSEAKFRFAPINGKFEETQMASRFIEESKSNSFAVGQVLRR